MRTAEKHPFCPAYAWERINPLRDHFTLYAGDRELGVLKIGKIGGLAGVVARLDLGDDNPLVFDSESPTDRYIQVHDMSTNTPIARYKRNRQGVGGTLWLANSGHLFWRSAGGRWSHDRMFANADGNALIRFAADGTVTNIAIEDSAATSSGPDLPLVLAMGWLLIVLERDRAK